MFSAFFNLDNPVFKFLSTLVDLTLLNIMFLISCLPVFTIGTALTSMQYVMITGWDTQNAHLIRKYTKSFKQNFKQSTILWLIMLAVGAFLGVTGFMMYQQSKVDGSTIFMIMIIIFVLICIAYLCIFTYVWPVLAKFDNTTLATVKNAFVLSVSHLPSTLVVWLMFGIAAYFIATNLVVAAFAVLILCAVLAYFQGKVFRNVFAPYLGEGDRHYEGDYMEHESSGVDLEHSYAEAKREVAELAAGKDAVATEPQEKEEHLS